jgi:hypothetical protein
LIREDYCINNHDVTRASYLKAARKNPGWPQYEEEPAGQIARPGLALERKKFDLFIRSVFEKPHHAEARAWLKAGLRPKSRSLAGFPNTKAALEFVDKLYFAGAATVIIAAIYPGQRKKLFADRLLVQLPPSKPRRARLRKICQSFCRNKGGAVMPEKDIGETHLCLMLA